MCDLTRKYMPRTLSEVKGQEHVTATLAAWARAPESGAFLLSGPTGTGKTCTAYALARDLGVDVDEEDCGGFHVIASGEQTAESVRSMGRSLSLRPMFGSGWHVVLVDECDRMSQAAEHVWLSLLERLPPRVCVVFTTNDPDKLAQRFRDRCEEHHYSAARSRVAPAIRELVEHVWSREAGTPCPLLDCELMPEESSPSFRLALRRVGVALRGLSIAGAT
jgi:DNA polymerase III gamma/tau subunit